MKFKKFLLLSLMVLIPTFLLVGCHIEVAGSTKSKDEISDYEEAIPEQPKTPDITFPDGEINDLYNNQKLRYSLLDDGTYAVGLSSSTSATKIIIPDRFKNIPVTQIRKEGFAADKIKITEIQLGRYIHTLGEKAFSGAKISTIHLPDAVTTIGEKAFENCQNLTTVTMTDNVNSIGSYAFFKCINLSTINLSNQLTTIENNVFQGCTALTTVTLPAKTQTIKQYAFGNTGLETITLPNTVTEIGQRAFSNCTNLTNIDIPQSVTTIGAYAFQQCEALSIIRCHCNHNATYVSKWNNWDKSCYASVVWQDDIIDHGFVIRSTGEDDTYTLITYIGTDNRITIPASYQDKPIPTINQFAFYQHQNLTEIVLPNTITTIKERAFAGCKNLTTLIIPDSVQTIDNYAFYRCASLPTIIIPASVQNLGSTVFGDCPALRRVYCVATEKPTNWQENWNYGITTWQPKVENYTKILWGCTDFAEGFVYRLIDDAYYTLVDCYLYGNIEIPSTYHGLPVTTIGTQALLGTWTTAITIPESITQICDYAFAGCNGLIYLKLPANLMTIGDHAFDNCYNLESIIIPASVTSMGDIVFNNCEKLSTINCVATEKPDDWSDAWFGNCLATINWDYSAD